MGGSSKDYSEILDYRVNYTTGDISLSNHLISETGSGTILVEYLKVYGEKFTFPVDGDEKPLEKLGNTGIVRLDYHEETFPLKQEKTNDSVNVFSLKLPAIDPLRRVSVNNIHNHNKWTVLEEGKDYTVDYDNKTVTLKIPQKTDWVECKIAYTPAIWARSLILQYHLQRKKDTDDVIIYPNFIEYKS